MEHIGLDLCPWFAWWMGSRIESQGPRSHFRQASIRKLNPLGDTPDLLTKIILYTSKALQQVMSGSEIPSTP